MNYQDISKGIRFHRSLQNLTLEELSELSSVNSSHISHVENGDKNFSFETIIKILNALNINFSDCLAVKSQHQLLIENLQQTLKQNFECNEIEFFKLTLKSLNSQKE